MARLLSQALESIVVRAEGRQPASRIEIYDLRSDEGVGDTKINAIVRGQTLPALLEPEDFTPNVTSVEIEETAGDYVQNGINTTSIMISFIDPNNEFDPFNTIGNPTGNGRFLRRRNAVRIYEGDEQVDFADWEITFTGLLVGQPGRIDDRNPSSGAGAISMRAVGRAAGFLKYDNTGASHPIGTAYLDIGQAIATSDMGLDLSEIAFSGWGSQVTFVPVQTVKEPPLVSIARFMFPDGFVPYFNGQGILSQVQPLLITSPDRVRFDNNNEMRIEQPFSELDPVNSVTIIGLDATLERVDQPRQNLGEMTITTGYFTQDETKKLYWVDDRTLTADNVTEDIIRSINGGLSFLGADETFVPIPAPNGQAGSIGVAVTFTTGFAPWLIIFLTITYIVFSWLPNIPVTFGFIGQTGYTINVGGAIAAAALAAALLVMSKIGRGIYSFEGEPFEFAHLEISGEARAENTLTADLNEIEIENHFISSQAQVDDIARDVLFEQQARGNPRTITSLHDLRLEPSDVLQLSNGRTFIIDKITRTLSRPSSGLATYSVFETTAGLRP